MHPNALQPRLISERRKKKGGTEMFLVKQAQRGDADAFVALIEKYKMDLYKVAKACLKNEEDVADVMQETTLSAWEHIGELKKAAYFKTWLTRILINNCNEMLRHKGRVFPTMEMEEGIFEEPGYVDCEWKEILASLDEKYQVVMLLYYSKSLSVKEIAALLEISQNTVLTRLSRARKQLRAEYEGGYIHG